MTQDVEIILKGLSCCSKTNPWCESCPYTEEHCRELETDAADLLRELLSKIAEQSSIIDSMTLELEDKNERIYCLEERLGMMYE